MVITGTNDQPVIAAVDVEGAVTEDTTVANNPNTAEVEEGAFLTDTGSVTFTDADATDLSDATVAIKGTAVASTGASVSEALATALTGAMALTGDITDKNAGTVTWTFALDNSLVQYLAKDETVTVTYTITITDDSGAENASRTEDVTVVITGTNDVPVITLATPSTTFTEVAGADTAANAVRFGTAATTEIADVDNGATLKNLSVSIANAAVADGASEQWILAGTTMAMNAGGSYAPITIGDVDYTATVVKGETTTTLTLVRVDGENLTLAEAEALLDGLFYNNTSDNPTEANRVFSITVTDENNATSVAATKTIAVEMTNDTPVLSATLTAHTYTDTTDDNTFTNVTGTLSRTDRDEGDTAAYSITDGTAGTYTVGSNSYNVAKAGTYGTLYLNSTSGAYEFVPNDTAIEGRKTDASESFTLVVADALGATDTKTLTISITGANDTPVLATVTQPTAVADTSADNTFADITGSISGTDRDTADTVSYELTGFSVTADGADKDAGFRVYKTSTYGIFYLNTTTGAYKFVVDDAEVEKLKTTATASFSVNATDGTLDSTSQTLTFTFNGVNDTPDLAAVTPHVVTDTAASDSFANVTGNLVGTDRDVDALTYGISGGVSGTYTVGANSYDVSSANSYGTLYLNSSSGAYTFVVNASAVNALQSGIATASFGVFATDGTATSISRTITIDFNGANDSPVLTDTLLTMTAVSEKAPAPSGAVGELISIFTGGVSDVDTLAVKGIAITAVDTTKGELWYTTDAGTTWTQVGTVTETSALLLADNAQTRLYFKPVDDGTVTAVFTFKAWDRTSGAAGTKVDTTTGSAFSSATDVVAITVTPVNDPPTLTTISTLSGATEDTAYVITYASLEAAANEADPEGLPVSFRVEAISTGTLERWDATANGGTGGWVEASAGYLLSSGGELRWTPASNANGTLNAFTVKAYDGVNASDVAVQVKVAVTAVNDQPVLADTNLTMTTVQEDVIAVDGAPSGAVGNLITTFVGGISDADGGDKGIAITGVNANGTLWFGILSGGETPTWTWTAVSGATADHALLLASNSSTRLFFQPALNYNGTLEDAFTFVAWDLSNNGGIAGVGTYADTNSGDSTYLSGFSVDDDTVGITVTAVNDLPTNTVTTATFTVEEDSSVKITGLNTSDPDGGNVTVTLSVSSGSLSVGAVTGVTILTNGTSSVQLVGLVSAVSTALTTADNITYTPAPNFNGTVTLTMTTNDGLGGLDTDNATITVTPVNDQPVLADTNLTMTSVAEDASAPVNGTTVYGNLITNFVGGISDDDGGQKGIAITGVNANGTLWVGTLSGSDWTWTAVTGASPDNALLLSSNSSTRLFFQPALNYNGTLEDAFTFVAWDGTYGTAGSYIDTNSGATAAQLTAFSVDDDTVAITVTPVNDAPTATYVSATETSFTLLVKDPDTGASLSLYNWTNGSSSVLTNGYTSNATSTITVNRSFSGINATSLIVTDGSEQSTVQIDGKDVWVVWGTNSADTPDLEGFGDYSYLIYGYGGNDILTGDVNRDVIFGGAGNDNLVGGSGNDLLDGGLDNDTLNGGAGADTLVGGAGINTYVFNTNDVAVGETVTFTSDATDTFSVVTSTDFSNLNGGTAPLTGLDAINIASGQTATFNLAQLSGLTLTVNGVADGVAETLVINGTTGSDTISLSGLTLNNVVLQINGGNGNDTITGSAGNDVLNGGDGNDSIVGGNGNDTITAGAGADSITGGDGVDRFVFNFSSTASPSSDSTLSEMDVLYGAASDTFQFVDSDTASPVTAAVAASKGNSEDAGVLDFRVEYGVAMFTLGSGGGWGSVPAGPEGNTAIDTLEEVLGFFDSYYTTDGSVLAFQFGSDSYLWMQNGSQDVVVQLAGVQVISDGLELKLNGGVFALEMFM